LEKYTLIVAEKPDVAARLAFALDLAEKPKLKRENGVPYYEVSREKKIVVVSALGHLYTVSGDDSCRRGYPAFGYKWVPRYEAERGLSRIRIWLKTISKLAENADGFIDACDYDIEGSIIGYCILKYACKNSEKDAKRMKYSTLTKEDLESAYVSLLPHLDFSLVEAGLTRHEVDWLYGINLSRALTTAAKNLSGYYATLSTGRVQGPTLKFLAIREKSIKCFVPIPFWRVNTNIKIGDQSFDADYEKGKVETKIEAHAIVNACAEKTGKIVKVERKKLGQPPPFPFDLGGLQAEAYRLFGYTPMQTLSAAQKLYVAALISYPRTGSQKLPAQIGYEKILKNLAKSKEYNRLSMEILAKSVLRPREGIKEDPAHPAIYPTGKLPAKPLDGTQKNIWNVVVRRFLAVFSESALRETLKATIDICGEMFILSGKHTLDQGWIRFYEPFASFQEIVVPPIQEGQLVCVQKVVLEDAFTQPPPRYNPGSLLKKMERAKIGTKSTRAGVIQTLYDRKYVYEKRMVVTDLGFEVTNVMRKYCPSVVSADFSKKLEERMEAITLGTEKKESVLAQAVESLKPVLASLKENEKAVGEQLSLALRKAKLEERVVGVCPICGSGKLVILTSKKSGKRFVGCTNYFAGICTAAFPLPQNGTVKPSGKPCRSCGWFTVKVWLKRKRVWNLCINPGCLSKAGEKKL
jgi:DNA topoisomerase-1